MKTINLREYYPTIYRRDHLISLPDAVASALHEGKASEVAYQVRVFRNKAYYSLEWAEARGELPASTAADPYTLLAANYEKEQLYQALAALFIAIESAGALSADSQIQLALQEKAQFYENGAAAAASWIFFFLGELHGLIRKEEAQHKGQGKGEIDAGVAAPAAKMVLGHHPGLAESFHI